MVDEIQVRQNISSVINQCGHLNLCSGSEEALGFQVVSAYNSCQPYNFYSNIYRNIKNKAKYVILPENNSKFLRLS